MIAKVRKYDRLKGFGWLEIADEAQLRFFHVSEWKCKAVPVDGQLVSFSEGLDRKGRTMAINVMPVEEVAEKAEVAQKGGTVGAL